MGLDNNLENQGMDLTPPIFTLKTNHYKTDLLEGQKATGNYPYLAALRFTHRKGPINISTEIL
jgi:hypothetical protein